MFIELDIAELDIAELDIAELDIAVVFPCPSNECWDYTETDGCTLKSMNECGSEHICKHDGISVQFSHDLFGTKTSDKFDEDDTCFNYNAADSTFNYDAPLGECGQQISKDG